MIPNKNLNTNDIPANVDNGQWIRAKNILMTRGFKSIRNEDGFSLDVNIDYKVIGKIELVEGYIVFSAGMFVGPPSGYQSCIHKVVNGVVTPILKSIYFDFDLDYPIEGLYRYNAKGELIIAFGGYGVTPRIMNLDNLPFKVYSPNPSLPYLDYEINVTGLSITAQQAASLTQFFPDVILPNYTPVAIYDHGYCVAGAYHFAISYYINDDDDTTDYLNLSRPVYINDIKGGIDALPVGSVIPITYIDNDDGDNVGKSLQLTISNLDLKYKRFKLGVVIRSNNALLAYEVGDYDVSASSVTFTYSGVHKQTISYAEILSNTTKFKYFNTITQLEGKAIVGGITEETIDYQKYANNIDVTWVSKSSGAKHYRNSVNIMLDSGFMPDEVYALYIHLIKKDGTITPGYHIPGRIWETYYVDEFAASGVMVLEYDTLTTYGLAGGTTYTPNAEELLIDSGNSKVFHTRDTSTALGVMGFWENTDEYYPQDSKFEVWDVTAGVGHRKAGSVANKNGNVNAYLALIDDGSGGLVNVRHHKMPSHYRLYPGAGSVPNSIVGLSISNINIPNDILGSISGFCFSYAKRDLQNSTVLGTSPIVNHAFESAAAARNGNYTRFYDHNLFATEALLKPRYLKVIYEATDTATYVANNWDFSQITTLPPIMNDIYQVVDNYDIHAANNSATVPANNSRELCISLHSTNADRFSNPIPAALGTFNIANLMAYNPNVYDKFYNQVLIPFGSIQYVTTANTYNILDQYGADTVITDHIEGNVFHLRPYSSGTPRWFRLTTYVPHYTGYRQKDKDKEWGEYTYVDVPYLYSNDFRGLQDLKDNIAFDTNANYIDNQPTMLRISDVFQDESTISSWRIFRANQYYLMSQIKGDIIKLTANRNTLYIQQKYELSISKLENLLSDGEVISRLNAIAAQAAFQVQLGDNILFKAKPTPILDSDKGYIGCQSKWSILLFEYGYVVCDKSRGKIFIVGETINEISKIDMTSEFQSDLETVITTVDNPFMGLGLHIGYDEINDRLLVTKRDYVTGIYSYSTYAAPNGEIVSLNPDSNYIEDYSNYQGELEAGTDYDSHGGDYPIVKYNGNYYIIRSGSSTDPNDINGNQYTSSTPFLLDSGDAYADYLTINDDDLESSNYTDYTFTTDNSKTWSYNLLRKGWICTHDYHPHIYLRDRYNSYALYNSGDISGVSALEAHIYSMNDSTKKGKYFHNVSTGLVTVYPSYFDIVVRMDASIEVIWNAIKWWTSVYLPSGAVAYNKTISKIMLYSATQCTGIITLDSTNLDWFNNNESRQVNEAWVFNNFRDVVIDNTAIFLDTDGEPNTNVDARYVDWFNQSQMISKYMVIRFIMDNDVYDTDKQDTVYINDINVTVAKQVR